MKQNIKNNDFVFGIRAVMEAVKANKEIDKVLIKRGLTGDLSKELLSLLKLYNIPYIYTPEEKLQRITRKNHQGVIAYISPIGFYELDELVSQTFEKGVLPFFMMLDGVTDVRNFGSIVRSAECAGVHGVIITQKGSVRISSDAVKTSAGALYQMPICRIKNIKQAVEYLQNCGIKVFGASEKTENLYFKEEYNNPLCLVMGAEDNGLSNEAIKSCDQLVKIPIQGKIESLNVSVAASVLMYEVVKNRMMKNKL